MVLVVVVAILTARLGEEAEPIAIEVANRHHMAMIFTHQRHFLH